MRCAIILFLLHCAELQEIPSTSTNLNVTRYRRQNANSTMSCTLPPQPKNGRWILVNDEGNEGGIVSADTLLRFYCKKAYKLSSSPYRVCDKHWNTRRFPECLKLCPPMHSTSTVIMKCVDKAGEEIGCHEATHESYLTYTCAPFYEVPFGYKTTFLCLDGEWNFQTPICQPICGKKVHDDTRPLIYGGKVETVIEYPWVAVIFRKEISGSICGGSIISQKLVLTAAHCVTNTYGDALPADDYLVAAAKLHNKYNDNRDEHAQYLDVFRITVHPTYRGNSRRFLGDIAVLVTKEPFVFNEYIQPVCFSEVKNINLQVGTIGVVAGFGIAEGGEASEELRTLEIPYKSEATCSQELPGDWGDRYNVIDKLCAGHYNKSKAVCIGDSGNGLVFRNPDNNRYYIHGIVSVAYFTNRQCNIQQNSLYTKVAFHYEFIDREIAKYYLKDCPLPPYPENGIWVTEIEGKMPGDSVPSSTLVKISCNEGYKLSSDSSHIKCESSFIMPTCQQLCPDIALIVLEYNCTNKEGEGVSCNEATDYTTLTFECPKHYSILDSSKNTRQCLNGSWELPEPACQPIEETSTEYIEEDTYPKIICVYDAKQSRVKPEDLNATLCNYVIYDSVGLSPDGNLRIKSSSSDKENKNSYRNIIDMKKNNRELKILLSVHGSGMESIHEYPVVAADPVKRSIFVASATDFLEQNGYDGLNVHWDTVLDDDGDNFIALMKEIKAAFGKRGWLITATVYYTPFYMGYRPEVLYTIVDWINVASYNLYTEWSKYTGQNSALYPAEVENDYERDSNLHAIESNWRRFGKDKISPSIAFFGRYYTLKNPRKHGLHAPVTGGTGSNHTGRINFSDICEKYSNWTRVWDNEQKNPYKYYNNKWVGYDDEDSVKLKAAFILKEKFFGITVYPVNGDDVFGRCGPKQTLLTQVHAGLDLENPVDVCIHP